MYSSSHKVFVHSITQALVKSITSTSAHPPPPTSKASSSTNFQDPSTLVLNTTFLVPLRFTTIFFSFLPPNSNSGGQALRSVFFLFSVEPQRWPTLLRGTVSDSGDEGREMLILSSGDGTTTAGETARGVAATP
ncbi:unnamed protein product [Tuber aestivum]|uniref:Uncharacterized protein n=1 Tax=Tuber aestivum TaxID=59557 RepID=A0A292Q877_9PEZI|nr:unnamed protein product [Tuber aestivum]